MGKFEGVIENEGIDRTGFQIYGSDDVVDVQNFDKIPKILKDQAKSKL